MAGSNNGVAARTEVIGHRLQQGPMSERCTGTGGRAGWSPVATLMPFVVVLATGCGLSVAGELVVVGDLPPGDDGADATVSPGDEDGGSGTDDSEGPVTPGRGSDAGGAPKDGALHGQAHGDAGDGGHAVPDGEVPETPEGGLPSHGTMACPQGGDASACDVGTSVCCTCPSCAVPFPTICLPTFPRCVPGGVYDSLTCGSAANCPGAAVCCASFATASRLGGATCEASCAAEQVQLCTGSTECAHGKTCQALTSMPGFNGCQ